mgnify:CR=1 FL=1
MFCAREALHSESDVEQKLVWPLLTRPNPVGMGYEPAEIATKHDIRRYEIDKGSKKRLYYPDYIVLLAGFPAMVVEAKAPGESLDDALDEARLYAAKLNESFPSGINPCLRILASNGEVVATAASDSTIIDLELPFSRLALSDPDYANLS